MKKIQKKLIFNQYHGEPYRLLGADYMDSFRPGWNLTPVNRAAISASYSQIDHFKIDLWLHGENSRTGKNSGLEIPAWSMQPGLRYAARSTGLEFPM